MVRISFSYYAAYSLVSVLARSIPLPDLVHKVAVHSSILYFRLSLKTRPINTSVYLCKNTLMLITGR